MRLSELISSMDLSVYPTIGILVFFGVFVLVGLRALRSPRSVMKTNAALVLEDDLPGGSVAEGSEEGGRSA